MAAFQRIGVLTAMEQEYSLALSFVAAVPGLIVGRSGIGKVNAALATRKLLDEGVDLIVNTGCAGGLNEMLSVGDAVIGTSFSYHDVWCGPGNERGQVQGFPLSFDVPSNLRAGLEERFVEDPGVHFGEITSGDSFIESVEDDERVLSVRPNALACDMESGAIAQTCYLSGVPFLACKIISDVHGGGASESWSMYEDFWSRAAEESFGILKRIVEFVGR